MIRLFVSLTCLCVLLKSSAGLAATYTYSNIIDSTVAAPTGNYLNIGDAAISGNKVAFKAGYDQGYLGIINSIFTSTGGPRTEIVQELGNSPTLGGGTFSSFGRPAIDGNKVYFGSRVFLPESFRYGDGIFSGTGARITTPVCYYLGCYNVSTPVVSAAVPPTFLAGSLFKTVTDPLASAGQLAFRGSTISETIPNAIYTLWGSATTRIVGLGDSVPSGDRLSSIDANYGFSAGTVAFRGEYRTEEGIFTGAGGPLTTIAKKGDSVPSGGTFSTLHDPAISGSKVAFLGSFAEGSGIFTGDGGSLLTVVRTGDATPSGDTFSSFSVPSIGGATVAFRGSHSGGEGIYTKTGAVLRTVVEIGDSFFGSTVASLNFSDLGLDPGGSGNLAFTYGLADGRTGVAMAVPGAGLPTIFQDAAGAVPVPDSVGIVFVPVAKFEGRNLTKAYLAGADLKGANGRNVNLTNAYLRIADLTNADLRDANLRGANFEAAQLTGANLSGANVTGTNFNRVFVTTTPVCSSAGCTNFFAIGYGGINPAQLAETTNYQAHDLSGIRLQGNDLTSANLAGQNLTGADFTYATLTGASFSGAEIRGANFGRYWFSTIVTICANARNCLLTTGIAGTGISPDQLSSTRSFLDHDLTGINFGGNDLAGGNFAGQNLSNTNFAGGISGSPAANLANADFRGALLHNANFATATLTSANLSGADARGASFTNAVPTDAVQTNLIRSNGHVSGLDLAGGQTLLVHDYNVTALHTTPIFITVDQHFAMGDGGALRMMLEADAWDSTISFTAGIPVSLGGTLELVFAEGTNVAGQYGRTFKLFNWSGVESSGAFTVASPYRWNLSNLYTSGEVTLIAVPEPSLFVLAATGIFSLAARRKARGRRNEIPPHGRRLRIEPLEDRRLLSITVNTLVDENDGIGVGGISLRDAIAAAPPGETIDFAPALTSGGPATILLTHGELAINKNLTINGPGAALLTIQALDPTPNIKNGDGSRIFNIDDGTSAWRTVSISGLTLTGGDISGEGGAIFSKEALTVTSSKITGNLAIAAGGGIHNDSGTLIVTGSTISGNSSWSDGGGINSRGNTTVTGSTISGNESGKTGGGIWHSGGTLTVTDCNVDRNFTRGAQVTKGGGIYSGANLTLSRSTVTGNIAGNFEFLYVGSGGYGGGIYASGSLTISESTISGNTASYAWDWRSEWAFVEHFGGNGGGICHTHGAATIIRSQISNNLAKWAGGGIAHYDGSLFVADSTISGNRGDFQGGGIYSISRYTSRSSTSLSVNRSTISDNSTGSYGGGIWSQGGNLTITSTTISGNIAHSPPSGFGSPDTGFAGGVYSDNLTSTVSHSTITRNWAGGSSAAGNGGGIRTLGSMAITRSIVAGNTHGVVPVPDDVSGSVEVSLGLLGVNTFATITDNGGNLIGMAGAPIDPLLGPLADNGGPTLPDGSKMLTHAPLPGSPAIDAIDPTELVGMTGNVVSANLGPSAYSASQWAQWLPGAAPEFAFDGIVAAGWDAGNYPTPVQWLEVDLKRPQDLTGFRLYVEQSPAGNTIHEVWVSSSPIKNNLTGATLIHTFAGFTADLNILTVELPSAVAARFVQIRTTESPSWIGWDEVQVFAGDIPLFDQRGTPFGRGFGDRFDMGAFESQPMPPAFYGDYNGNGIVDAADYTVWRDHLGSKPSPYSGADGSGNGIVDAADGNLWKAHFGQVVPTTGAGSGSFASESLVSMVAQQPPALPRDGAAKLLTVARAETNFPADPAPGRTGGRLPAAVSAAKPIAQPLRQTSEDERATQRENPPPALAVSSPIVPHRPVNRSLRAAVRAPAVAARDEALLAWLASLTRAVQNNGAAEMERPSTRSVVESLDEGCKGVLHAAFGIFDGHEGAGRGRHW